MGPSKKLKHTAGMSRTDVFIKPIMYLYWNPRETHHFSRYTKVIQFKWGLGKLSLQVMISFFPFRNSSPGAHAAPFVYSRRSCLCQSRRSNATLRKSNKLQRREPVAERGAERFSSFYLFSISIHTSRLHRNCCQQVPRSIKQPVLGYKQITFYFLMAQIDPDAFECSERQHVFEQGKEHSKEIQCKRCCFFPSLSLSVREPCTDLTAKRTN